MVMALPFIALAELEDAVNKLSNYSFGDPDTPDLAKMEEFKLYLLSYFRDTWLHGHFPPRMWNYWLKTKNLTNNRYSK